MPSKAITGDGRTVFAKYHNKFQLRDWFKEYGLFCPHCKEPMFPRGGSDKLVSLHFAHKSGRCSTSMEHHPEGDDHTAAKEWVYELLTESIKKSPEEQHLEVDMEIGLPQCGSRGRIADVGIRYKGDVYCVFECQLSPISQENLTQRIQDYNEQAIESYWLLGKHSNTRENIQAILKYTRIIANLEVEYRNIDGSDFIDDILR